MLRPFWLSRRPFHASALLRSVIETPPAAQSSGESVPKPRNVPLRDTQYRLHAASMLVRNLVTLRPLNELETAYTQYREELQEEYSRGTFDIMTTHKREVAKLGPAKEASVPEFPLHDAYIRADGDMTSLMRRLERKLYFVVRGEQGWMFPATLVQSADAPLHKCTRRMMERLLGTDCELYHVGRAPIAYHKETMADRVAAPLGTKVPLAFDGWID